MGTRMGDLPMFDDTPGPATLDPDLAMWPENAVSRWPFTGSPTTGTWPLGFVGVDNTGTVWVCTVGGRPGTWVSIGGGGGFTAADLYMPGVVADGVTDNTAAINDYFTMMQSNGWTGATPQVLPPGKIAVEQQ